MSSRLVSGEPTVNVLCGRQAVSVLSTVLVTPPPHLASL